MTSSRRREESPILGQDAGDEMVRYGITRVPTDYFYCEDYRYTRLEDAIAQAKRQRPVDASLAMAQSRPAACQR